MFPVQRVSEEGIRELRRELTACLHIIGVRNDVAIDAFLDALRTVDDSTEPDRPAWLHYLASYTEDEIGRLYAAFDECADAMGVSVPFSEFEWLAEWHGARAWRASNQRSGI